MNKLPKLFIVTGATCTGKTATVNAVLEQHPTAHVICFDSCQIYDHFAIGTGRDDALFPEKAHLYGHLSPEREISVQEYIDQLLVKVKEVEAAGGIPFLEGGSRKYMLALNELYKNGEIDLEVIGIEPPDTAYMDYRFAKRTEGFVESGILEEIQSGIEKGYGTSFMLKNYEVYEPFLHALEKKHSLEDAKKLVRERMKEMHEDQLRIFKKLPYINWLTVTDPECVSKLINKFNKLITQQYKIEAL